MNNKRAYMRILSFVMGIFGIVAIFSVVLPMAKNEARARQEFPDLLRPLILTENDSIPQGTGDVLSEQENADVDYTKVANWFPGAGSQFASSTNVSFYTISIPSLGIENASVALGGEDLSQNIIQYPGTALPGKIGNSVLFGHSILPIYFDPRNYLSIFSTIDKLDKGDEILVDFDGISFTYRVKEKYRVKPTDVYILNQNSSGEFLSLVTCWPMGHPSKPERLVVKAELAPRVN